MRNLGLVGIQYGMKRSAQPSFSTIALIVYGITAWIVWRTLEPTSDGRYVGELENLFRFLFGASLALVMAVVSLSRRERFLWFSLLMLAPAVVVLFQIATMFSH